VATKAPRPNTGEPDHADDAYRPGYEVVAEKLLQYIADEDLQPGDRLPTEQGLAGILGTTRNVTREAVKVLAAIGRLNVRRGAGIFVAGGTTSLGNEELTHYQPTDMEHVLMLLDYRRTIETETARRAASIATPMEVKAIREAADNSAEVGRHGGADAFSRADEVFHSAVAIAAHNVFLQSSVATTRRLAAQSDVLLFHGTAAGSLEEAAKRHIEIAQAIASGDEERAARLMAEHVETTKHQFERRIRDRLFSLGRATATTVRSSS
jgi:DNA-binding FadR family transcriptional regulator